MIRIDTEELLKLQTYYMIGRQKSVSSSSSKETQTLNSSMTLEEALRILPRDPQQLIKLFNLDDPNNRYILLKLLGRNYLEKLTQKMDKKSMLLVMQFFTVDKLLTMLNKLPKTKLLEMLLQVFSKEEMLKMMPEKYMDKFLTNNEIKKEDMMKSLQNLPPDVLSKMIESVTGKPSQNLNSSMSKDQQTAAMLQELGAMSEENFKKALVSMDKKNKINLIMDLTEKDKNKWDLFPKEAFISTIETMPKDMMLMSMQALQPEDMINMINVLPDEMLTQSLTLLNPEIFATQMLQDNTDLLAQLLVAA